MTPNTEDPHQVSRPLPEPVAETVGNLAGQLCEALRPYAHGERTSAEIDLLWMTAKLLTGVAGGWDMSSIPGADRHHVTWVDVAGIAADLAEQALGIAAAGMTTEQAAERVAEGDVDAAIDHTGTLPGGVRIDLLPPDYEHTMRTLTVAVEDRPNRELTVTTDRGPAPTPRPYTPATLLQTQHHLHRLAATLGRVVLEPWQDGVPMCGRADREVTCQVCGTTVGADVARRVDAAPAPYYPQADVCSITCARAASAGEHRP